MEVLMDLRAAMRAAAPGAPEAAVDGLLALPRDNPALANPRRAAALIGQCAHESDGFRQANERLYYTTAARLCAVWPSRFPDEAAAMPYLRNPEKLANTVYAARMGNTQPGDGWRFIGRGWLQLTGRSNYRAFSRIVGVDLEEHPEMAADPAIAWRIAAAYLETRYRGQKSALQWADTREWRVVTRIVNGGLHGLADRIERTELALAALGESK